jgi:hypothetical protein
VQIVPSLEAYTQSARVTSSIEYIFEDYLMPIKYAVKMIAPDIFGNPASYNYFGKGFYHESIITVGDIPLVFSVFALLLIRKRKIIRFFLWASILSFIFGIKSPITEWFYHLPIPFVSTFTPSRIFFITSMALAVTSAFGFDYWLRTDERKMKKCIVLISLTLITIIVYYVSMFYLSAKTGGTNRVIEFFASPIKPSTLLTIKESVTSLRNVLLPIAMLVTLILLSIVRNKKIITPIITILVLAGQLYFLNKYVVTGSNTNLYPDHFVFSDVTKNQHIADRFLTFGLPIVGDIGLEKRVYSPDGIDPVFSRRYGELVYAAKNGGIFMTNIPRIEVSLSEYSDDINLIRFGRTKTLMSLLGVSRIYNYERQYKYPELLLQMFPQNQFSPLWKKDGWQAYENTRAFPRAFFVDTYVLLTDPQIIIDTMFDNSTNLRNTAVLEEQPSNLTQNSDTSGDSEATIIKYDPSRVSIKTSSDRNRLLLLSDTYYPGWKASIDEIPTKIYRADFALRGVVVPAGNHTITFVYAPVSFTIGAITSLITFLALLTYSVVITMRKTKRN